MDWSLRWRWCLRCVRYEFVAHDLHSVQKDLSEEIRPITRRQLYIAYFCWEAIPCISGKHDIPLYDSIESLFSMQKEPKLVRWLITFPWYFGMTSLRSM